MHIFSEALIHIVYSTLVGASTGMIVVQLGLNHYKRFLADLGDEKGSFKMNGRWYVIKREGE